ncbi:ribosomal protein L5 domain-containing protein [Entophlyctis helioformis]|nr:ribosomal protein L5 domain-containing protein [Entophlyctis helioformis]KAI8925824.1 ribosomal protein L5 domain-containing protein [Entophlyctis helioformis]
MLRARAARAAAAAAARAATTRTALARLNAAACAPQRRSLATAAAAAADAADAAPAVPIVQGAVFRPRLEEHYYNTVLEDLLVLTYDHSSPLASLPLLNGPLADAVQQTVAAASKAAATAAAEQVAAAETTAATLAADGNVDAAAAMKTSAERLRLQYESPSFAQLDGERAAAFAQSVHAQWHRRSQQTPYPLHELYSTTLPMLPTHPESAHIPTSLLSIENSTQELMKRRYRKMMYNPIDYTAVPKEILFAKPPAPPAAPFAPVPSRMPVLKRVVLKIWCEAAVTNKNILLSAVMSLQSISGVRADPLFAEVGDAAKRIRAGMPLGARVELTGPRMFEFVDKLTQCVMPRIREFKGLNPTGDGAGAISFKLPDTAIGYFPDIEPHFDMFPRLFETDVILHTTGKNDWETALCLSAFQMPFMAERVQAAEAGDSKAGSDDPWAQIRSAKTREERIALHKAAQSAKKK